MASGEGVLMLSVSGMRGNIGSTLTPEVVQRFAAGFAAWLAPRKKGKGPLTIALGRDGRRGSDLFASYARAALLASGCDVLDLDIAMTPTVGVVVDRLADAGLVVTASHNPQNWCGLKPIIREPGAKVGKTDASAPGKSIADEIISAFKKAPTPAPSEWKSLGHARVDTEAAIAHLVAVHEALGASHKHLAAFSGSLLIDNLGMSGAAMSDWALSSLAPGADIATMYPFSSDDEKPSKRGLFPHTPEPTAENLTGLAKAMKKAKASVGFAQDPDADRLAIVDEAGRYIGEEYTLVLAAMAMGEMKMLGKGDKIAVNLSTSRMIDDVAAGYGAKVIRTAVGEANVVEAMKKHKCVLGGEGNGGVIWPKVTYIRDSLGAMALVLALMSKSRKTISQLVAKVPAYAIVKRKVELSSAEQAKEAVARVKSAYARERLDTQDGVRVDFDAKRAWLHVRASNTEPIMRLIAEAPTQREAEAVLDAAARVIG